jgi:hypothetical protein
MTITLGASTMAMCAESSLGTIYTVGLGQVATYAVSGDELTLTFADDAGTMTFSRA